MHKVPSILIYDVGKTNKKLLLFNEQYNVIYERSRQMPEIQDEDGFACEDIHELTAWVRSSFNILLNDKRFEIKGVNFSAYGASFVYLDEQLQVIPPLYNYLKPLGSKIQKQFYETYGGESHFTKLTASPVLGNLNSGMQLYRLKYEKPAKYKSIKFALHLPQYLSFILTSALSADITSIGCHTNLWNFRLGSYHGWVSQEGVSEKLPAQLPCHSIAGYINDIIPAGGGLHDSSAALIPYLFSFNEPFVLLSTGTWCISLNPFNQTMLTDLELNEDCLCYLSYDGNHVKASRLFAGYEHEQEVKRLAKFYDKPVDYYTSVECDVELLNKVKVFLGKFQDNRKIKNDGRSCFQHRNLEDFDSYEHAYHQLISDIIVKQTKSTNLVLRGTNVKRIFVDGGFSKNSIYMYLLADAFQPVEVYAASVAQASALGAALIFHQHWNVQPLPANIINMKLYSVSHDASI